MICQQDTAEPLKFPMHNPLTSGDNTAAYTSFLANVQQFRAIGALPVALYFNNDATADNCVAHSASWHKSCHLQFNNSKLASAQKKREHIPDGEPKRPSKRKALDIQQCFFCEKGEEENDLHEVSTFDADKNIRDMITELNDTVLMTRIVGSDLMAIEAKYHMTCLTKLRNRYRSFTRMSVQVHENIDKQMNESRAFVELTSYIEKSVESGTLLFKLADLHCLYVNRL